MNSNLVIGERLGDGHFAEVRMAVERKTGTDVAVKIIDRHKVKTTEMINSEIEIMKRVAHPNIVKFIDHIRTPNSIFIILELVRGGDLFDTITESGNIFNKYLIVIIKHLSLVSRFPEK